MKEFGRLMQRKLKKQNKKETDIRGAKHFKRTDFKYQLSK